GVDGERNGTETVLQWTEFSEGDEFVDDHALAEHRADSTTGVARDTHDPRDGSENRAEHGLQTFREPGDVVMNQSKPAVDQRDERDERDQHRDDVEHEMQTFAGG